MLHGSQLEAMSNRPPMSDGEWRMFLTLLDRAQDRGRIGEALLTLGCTNEDAARISAQVDAHNNQQVIRPKAKAKAAAGNGAASSMAAGSEGTQAVVNANDNGAMTDASKRLRDGEFDFEDDGFVPVGDDYVEDPERMIQQFNHGLPSYRPPEPPRGPVRELWNVSEPGTDNIPFPHGVRDLAQWGATMLTMPKYKGWTFEQIFDEARLGNRAVLKYCNWIVNTYGSEISVYPKSQAPDLAGYLLRAGFVAHFPAPPITYTRTYR